MKKKILSIALVLCMVLAVLPTAVIVQAATPIGTALTQDNIGSYTNLTGGSTESEMVYYYLSENVRASETITVTGYVTLDLNGKGLDYPVLCVSTLTVGTAETSGYLTIIDSCGNGKIYGRDGASQDAWSIRVVKGSAVLNSGEIFEVGIKVDADASMTINGGKINGHSFDQGVLVYNNGMLYANGGESKGGIFNLSGAKITRADNVTTATTFSDVSIYNSGEINWGIFGKSDDQCYVNNSGTISGGTFNGKVINNDKITGGTFNGQVINKDKITGGIFNGQVSIEGSGTITGGTFYGGVDTGKISSDATWYEVKFDTNGGSRAPVTQVFVNVDDAKALKPTDPTRTGYTFVGWYEKDANGVFDTAFDFANTKVTEDITLYAKWVCAGEHTGGTATCTDKAVCTSCGEEYGDVNANNHDFTAQVKNADTLVSAATCQDKAVYYYSCSRCGEIEKSDTHTFKGELDSSKHTDTKEWSTKNETQHKQTWKCCGEVIVALENHEWKNGVCEECGYVCLHTGGTADCTHKAVCDVCGEEYGEVDGNNHATLTHVEAKAATTENEGNIEYWHCEDCGKYFGDKDGENEIALADTVIEKLDNPPTGEHTALWIALILISGNAFAAIYGKKKKRSAK